MIPHQIRRDHAVLLTDTDRDALLENLPADWQLFAVLAAGTGRAPQWLGLLDEILLDLNDYQDEQPDGFLA